MWIKYDAVHGYSSLHVQCCLHFHSFAPILYFALLCGSLSQHGLVMLDAWLISAEYDAYA